MNFFFFSSFSLDPIKSVLNTKQSLKAKWNVNMSIVTWCLVRWNLIEVLSWKLQNNKLLKSLFSDIWWSFLFDLKILATHLLYIMILGYVLDKTNILKWGKSNFTAHLEPSTINFFPTKSAGNLKSFSRKKK